MNFFYRIFGLTIESQCECPELIQVEGHSKADVFIRWGDVPEHLDNATALGNWVEGRPGQLLFRIAETGSYLIEAGTYITIQPYDDQVPAKDIRLYLLGSAMGAMLHQRQILPFHGSSVSVGEHVITFSGPSGIGKSTLAAALLEHGYRLLADDVSAISITANGLPVVNPGMPQIKLCSDAMLQLGRDPSQAQAISNRIEKYGCPEHSVYIDHPLASRAIYILGRSTRDHFEDIPLKGMDKFHALRVNTYRPSFVKAMGCEREHFELLRQLAGHVDVHMLLRPADGFRIDELANYVSHLIAK